MTRKTISIAVVALIIAVGGVWWLRARPSADERLARGRLAIERGDGDAAVAAALALDADGHREHALLLDAEIRLRAGDPRRAFASLKEVPPDGDFYPQALALAGRCQLELGDIAEAQRTFSYLLSLRENDVDGHRGLAAVHYDLGSWPTAVDHCMRWSELAPRDGRPHRLRGLIHKELSQFEDAASEYRAALDKDLKEHVKDEVRLEWAACLIKLGRFDEALAALDRLSPPATREIAALTSRAECLRGLGRGAEALVLAKQATAAGSAPKAAVLYATLLLEGDLPQEALPILLRAAEASPRDFQPHHLLVQTYARLGDETAAESHRREVREIQTIMDEMTELTKAFLQRPMDAPKRRRMAELYERMRMPDMAQRSLRLAIMAESRGIGDPRRPL